MRLTRWPSELAREMRRLARLLQRRVTAGTRKPRAASADARRGDDGPLMLHALSALLDRHAPVRRVMPHLALIERLLKRGGPASLTAMLSLPATQRALSQLEGLVDHWSPGLSALRSALAVNVIRLEATARSAGVGVGVPSTGAPDELDVSEVGVSSFVAAEVQWANAVAARVRGVGVPQTST